MAANIKMMLRGEEVTITDISAFEDLSVGIPFHLDDFRILGADGEERNWYDDLTDDEMKEIDKIVWGVLDLESSEADGEYEEELGEGRVRLHFCSGKFCPGLRWPASNVPHPTSCSFEHLNSDETLRVAAISRRKHGRKVEFEVPGDI